MKRRTALFGIAALLLANTVAAGVPATPASPPLPRDSVYQLSLSLADQSGHHADWRARRGKPQLVTMFYASCPYMCPMIIDSAKTIDKNLTPVQRQRLDVLLISIDPEHDTPATLQALAAKRSLDTTRWTLAAPAPGNVRAVAGVLGVRYRQLADGSFNHTSALLLLDADGRIVARTERIGGPPDPQFLDAVRKAATP
ncbi:MAG: SCO family protein [Proteobacteria bacterium]|nr:SCO family protein [Pseudomonadota bacterium]